MKFKSIIASGIVIFCANVNASGPYEASIKKIQTTSIGNPYNTVWLDLDITTSPCSSTNQHNRYTLTSNVQHSTVLAALMAGKKITIAGSDTCINDIEQVSNIYIKP